MLEDGKEVRPASYVVINKHSKVVALTWVNLPDPILVREDEDPELYKKLLKEGTAAIADPSVNHCCGLGVGKQSEMKING